MVKRTKEATIMLRVTGNDKKLIEDMAKKAGVSMTGFIMARVWGEVVEPAAQVAEAKSEGLEAVKARYGLKSGADLLGGNGAGPAAPVALRNFNASKSGWYDIVAREDYGEILQDNLDKRFWVHPYGSTSARPCKDLAEARRVFDRLGM